MGIGILMRAARVAGGLDARMGRWLRVRARFLIGMLLGGLCLAGIRATDAAAQAAPEAGAPPPAGGAAARAIGFYIGIGGMLSAQDATASIGISSGGGSFSITSKQSTTTFSPMGIVGLDIPGRKLGTPWWDYDVGARFGGTVSGDKTTTDSLSGLTFSSGQSLLINPYIGLSVPLSERITVLSEVGALLRDRRLDVTVTGIPIASASGTTVGPEFGAGVKVALGGDVSLRINGTIAWPGDLNKTFVVGGTAETVRLKAGTDESLIVAFTIER